MHYVNALSTLELLDTVFITAILLNFKKIGFFKDFTELMISRISLLHYSKSRVCSYSSRIVPTEARLSIRESLKTFKYIEEFVSRRKKEKENESDIFERWMYNTYNIATDDIKQAPSSTRWRKSCGNTLKGFVSLFLSKKQNNNSMYIEEIIDGSPFNQLIENLQIVFFSFRSHISSDIYNDKGRGVSENESIAADQSLPLPFRFFSYLAQRKVKQLTALLLPLNNNDVNDIDNDNDNDNDNGNGNGNGNVVAVNYPKIIFCNLTCIYYEDTQSLLPEDMIGIADAVKDHKWAIIKYNSNHFQVIQGYKSEHEHEHDHDQGYDQGSSGGGSDGYSLCDWQSKQSVLINKFASRNGFDKKQMMKFLSYLDNFASGITPHNVDVDVDVDVDAADLERNEREEEEQEQEQEQMRGEMDSVNYSKMFGINDKQNHKRLYWPSVSFRELDDSAIHGCGDRYIADSMMSEIEIEMMKKIVKRSF